MADRVLADFITIGGVKFPAGAVVEVPDEARDWLTGNGLIEPAPDAELPPAPPSPAMTEAAAAAIAELGLDATEIEGTGSGGRITKGDVDAYVAAQADAGAGDDADDEGGAP